MVIKFQRNLLDYRYLLMFDLASYNTGVCLWDIAAGTPVYTKLLTVKHSAELGVHGLFRALQELMQELQSDGIDMKSIVVYKEAMPTQIHTASSTVQTFVALARSHAVLDLFTVLNGIDVYDYVGVYPITTHSYLKKLVEFEDGYKMQKQDIKDYVLSRYDVSEQLTFDEYDAIFLAQTFVEVKWNKDLQEEIRAVRRHAKELKSERGIVACEEEEARLEKLKMIY